MLWLIVAILFIAIGVYVVGTLGLDADEAFGLFSIIFFGSLFWPFVLVFATIVGPFVGLYFLGARAREKREAESNK